MEAGSGVTPRIDQLIDLFNHRRGDLPAGLFDRRTQLVLNGRPFEEALGRSPSDPLVLMRARGSLIRVDEAIEHANEAIHFRHRVTRKPECVGCDDLDFLERACHLGKREVAILNRHAIRTGTLRRCFLWRRRRTRRESPRWRLRP
jgi:hypothetical protein